MAPAPAPAAAATTGWLIHDSRSGAVFNASDLLTSAADVRPSSGSRLLTAQPPAPVVGTGMFCNASVITDVC